MKFSLFAPLIAAAMGALSTTAASDVTFEIRSAEFQNIVGSNPQPELLYEGDAHEGPVYVRESGHGKKDDYYLFITNRIPHLNHGIHIMKYDPYTGNVTTWRDDSNMANGQVISRDGKYLYTCEQGNDAGRLAQISRTPLTAAASASAPAASPLVTNHDGLPFNSPNDIVQKSDGTIWFTDPNYGYLQGFRPKPVMGHHVFSWTPSASPLAKEGGGGFTKVVVDDLYVKEPNGIAFSPDERVLYITDSGAATSPDAPLDMTGPHRILAFDVGAGNQLSNGRLFATTYPGIPDGLKVDATGHVYSSSADGVHVHSHTGELIGKIKTPSGSGATNFVFGGAARDYFFMTTDKAIYGMKLNTKGAA